jgi:hypothetical protein
MLKAIEAEKILMACFAEGVQQQDMVRVMSALKISGGRYSKFLRSQLFSIVAEILPLDLACRH